MIVVADAKGRTDGSMHRFLEMIESPLPIVLMARTAGYRFNEALLGLDKFLLFEASEHGWDWFLKDTHEWGRNTERFPHFEDKEYKKFADFVAAKPPVITFTRELLQKDVRENHLPLDYPGWYAAAGVDTKEQFDKRVIEVFNFWGRSHEDRVRLHASLIEGSMHYGYSISDNPYYFENFMTKEDGVKWLSWWIPWYARMDMQQVLSVNGMSKISIAYPGAGVKTFRASEVSVNSVMLKPFDNLAWTFPWTKENSIPCHCHEEVVSILKALKNPNLYDIYVAGVENAKKYQADSYAKYLSEKIKSLV